jgi:mannose-6-phosphate isomerase-like protein (cupin superfamily)
VDVQNAARLAPFTTKDGSQIRELLAYRNSCLCAMSLAEATLPPGAATVPHYHLQAEEIYFILAGSGLMHLGSETRQVGAGDAIAIPRATPHQLVNTGTQPLVLLCCCSPAYEHWDTVLLTAAAEAE